MTELINIPVVGRVAGKVVEATLNEAYWSEAFNPELTVVAPALVPA